MAPVSRVQSVLRLSILKTTSRRILKKGSTYKSSKLDKPRPTGKDMRNLGEIWGKGETPQTPTLSDAAAPKSTQTRFAYEQSWVSAFSDNLIEDSEVVVSELWGY